MYHEYYNEGNEPYYFILNIDDMFMHVHDIFAELNLIFDVFFDVFTCRARTCVCVLSRPLGTRTKEDGFDNDVGEEGLRLPLKSS